MVLSQSLAVLPAVAGKKKEVPGQTVPLVAKYRREVYLGSATFQYPSDRVPCIYVHAFITSDDFFDGLKFTDSPAGPHFYKDKESLSTFPDTIVVKVEEYASWPLGCSHPEHWAPGQSVQCPSAPETSTPAENPLAVVYCESGSAEGL